MNSLVSKSRSVGKNYYQLALRLSGKRLIKISILFIIFSIFYFRVDEIPLFYQTIDGYIELVVIVRFAVSLLIIGCMFGAIKALSVFLINGFYGLTGRIDEFSTIVLKQKILSNLLYILALLVTYTLFIKDYKRVVFPFYQYSWLNASMLYLWLALGFLASSFLVLNFWKSYRRLK